MYFINDHKHSINWILGLYVYKAALKNMLARIGTYEMRLDSKASDFVK